MLRHLLALTLMLAAGCHLLFDGIEAVHEQSAPVDEVPSQGGSGGEDPAGGAGGIAPTCLDAETCADDGSQVCNVDLQQCTAPECTADMLCAIGEVCLPQGANAAVGACYENCIPFSDPCGDGYQCVDITGDGSDGACIPTGPADLGEACLFHDVSTGCAAGQICAAGINTCYELCNFWSASAGCVKPGDRCVAFGVCQPWSDFDPVPIGEPCSTYPGNLCAPAGDRLLGLCTAVLDDVECLRLCRQGKQDCPASEACTSIDEDLNPIGVCR